MTALCLSELARDLSAQPQPKWTINATGQWVQRPTILTRDGKGWKETIIDRSTK